MAWSPFDEEFEELRSFGHLVFASKDAPSDDKAVAAMSELVMQAHVRAAKESVNEGNVLTLGGEAAAAGDFVVVRSGAAPRQATSVTLKSSSSGLDVVFDCVDSSVVAEQKGHDNIKLWKDDSVYLWLDPGHTHNGAGQFIMVQVSAGGECHDLRNGDPKFDAAGLQVETGRHKKGWRAHLQLPWTGLGVEVPKPGEVWGLNLTRMDQPGAAGPGSMECSSWVTLPEGDSTRLDRWGHIVFAGEAGTETTQGASAAAAEQVMKTTHEARGRQLIPGGNR